MLPRLIRLRILSMTLSLAERAADEGNWEVADKLFANIQKMWLELEAS